MCGFCNVWVCVCVGFCNVWVCVCVGFAMCGCVCVGFAVCRCCDNCVGVCMSGCFDNCLGVLVICVLVFTVFCIVCTMFLFCFGYVHLFSFVLSLLV